MCAITLSAALCLAWLRHGHPVNCSKEFESQQLSELPVFTHAIENYNQMHSVCGEVEMGIYKYALQITCFILNDIKMCTTNLQVVNQAIVQIK